MSLNYTLYSNDITDYIVIQHTFKDNIENKARIFIIVVQKLKKMSKLTQNNSNI